MRRAPELLICIGVCCVICLCTPSARACRPPGPCYTWNGSEWVAYGCVASPCTDGCTVCSLDTCGCECEVTIATAESDVDVQGVGLDVTFTMTTSPAARYECVSWSGGGDPASGSASHFTTDWDAPGDKTVTVKTCGDNGDSQDIDVTIVGVDWVRPDHADAVDVDDGDGDGDTELWFLGVQESGTVDIEARPDPDVLAELEGVLPACWMYWGTWGIKTSDVTYSVDVAAPIAGDYYAQCGTSAKSTTFYLIKTDVAAPGVDEETEDDPGILVALNNNNDDGDAVMDIDDGYDADGSLDLIPPEPGDDDENLYESDLIPILFSVEPDMPLPPKGHVKLEVVRDPEGGDIKLWKNAEKGKGNEIELRSYNLADTAPGGDREKITHYLTNGVCAEGISTGPCLLKLSFNAGGQTIHTDTIKITVVEVDVLRVPEYLFASATYATPITFKINGLGASGTAYIHDISADLYLDLDGDEVIGPQEFVSCSIGDQFVAGDGVDRNNGTSNTYTGYILPREYSQISLGTRRSTGKAYFVVKALVSFTQDGHSVFVFSEANEAGANLDIFADNTLFAVEAGINGATKIFTVNITTGTQAAIDKDGEGKYIHWEGDACEEPIPHEEPINYLYGHYRGMDLLFGSIHGSVQSDAYEQTHAIGQTEMCAFTRLYDSSDWVTEPMGGGPFDEGVKNRYYGFRRGGYCYVSYGGREVNVLPSGEYAMDLNRTGGQLVVHLFDTGKCQISTVVEQSGGLNLGHVSGAFGIGWALASLEFPLWSAAFGVASSIAAIVDSCDVNGADSEGKAQGAIYLYSVLYKADTTSNPDPQLEGWLFDDGDESHGLKLNDKDWHAGDQWVFFVEIESACSLKSRYLNEAEVSSNVKFLCNDSEDFSVMELHVRD